MNQMSLGAQRTAVFLSEVLNL